MSEPGVSEHTIFEEKLKFTYKRSFSPARISRLMLEFRTSTQASLL